MLNIGIYCQHLLGVGHLTRCLAIAQGLVSSHTVHFIQGGEDIGRSVDHENFKHSFLPAITMNETDSSLFSKTMDLADCWQKREVELDSLSQKNFDALIVELYPFGRKKFGDEIQNFIEKVKIKSPKCKIICSVRDILVEKKDWDKRQQKIISVVHDFFDDVLVHSDESVVPFERTFSRASEIQDKLAYTGYISEPVKLSPPSAREGVLVSLGGGIVGDELVRASLDAAKELESIPFTFIKSPNMNGELKLELDQIQLPNVEVIEFSKNYPQLLANHKLSISLGGYNTMMNLLQTKTFGLIYPYQKSSEQCLRTRLFSEKGLLVELLPTDLETKKLIQLIEENLEKSDWNSSGIGIDGVVQTAQWLEKHL